MRSHRDGHVHTISLAGELDLANSHDVEAELIRVEATDAGTILLDLAGLTFMDSTAIRLLITADAHSRSNGHRLILHRAPDGVHRVLQTAASPIPPLHRQTRSRAMSYLHCPRCRLSINARAHYLTLTNCPRFLARTAIAVPLFSSLLSAGQLRANSDDPQQRPASAMPRAGLLAGDLTG